MARQTKAGTDPAASAAGRLPCTPDDLVAFTPPTVAERDPAPVFYLPHPTGREWGFFLSELTAAGLVNVSDSDLVDTLRDVAVADAPTPEIAAQAIAFCDQWDEWVGEIRESPSAATVSEATLSRWVGLSKDLARLSVVFLPASPAFAAMTAAKVRYANEAPCIAAEVFVRGWDNVPNGTGPLEYRATRQHKVDPATFAALERAIGAAAIVAIGRRAMELHQLDATTGKG